MRGGLIDILHRPMIRKAEVFCLCGECCADLVLLFSLPFCAFLDGPGRISRASFPVSFWQLRIKYRYLLPLSLSMESETTLCMSTWTRSGTHTSSVSADGESTCGSLANCSSYTGTSQQTRWIVACRCWPTRNRTFNLAAGTSWRDFREKCEADRGTSAVSARTRSPGTPADAATE